MSEQRVAACIGIVPLSLHAKCAFLEPSLLA